ncbi:DUF6415 family natural product biosynthesis protein [Streptomyces xiangluensis]|uniref:DUF6415 family natural product biosynthesis protein n=1 Tax=Streptomyces xiangluensis TaxID=2665720 RepID=A0ABV8YX30_9ACTN
MTAPATSPGWAHPVRAAELPLTPEGLRWVLAKVQEWQPYVDGSLLDELAAVLDDYTPDEDEDDVNAMRLRGHLMQLVNLAVTTKVVEQDQRVDRVVDRARTVRSEELPGDHMKAVGHVRQMAWALDELLELLLENQCIKEAP